MHTFHYKFEGTDTVYLVSLGLRIWTTQMQFNETSVMAVFSLKMNNRKTLEEMFPALNINCSRVHCRNVTVCTAQE